MARCINSPVSRGHPKGPVAEPGADVLGSCADKSELEVMDGPGTIQCHGSDDAAFHEVDNNRAQTALDDMSTQADDHGPAGPIRRDDRLNHRAIRARQNPRQGVEKAAERLPLARRPAKLSKPTLLTCAVSGTVFT